MSWRFTVGLSLQGKADRIVVHAEDALVAALKVKAERPDATIMYVRRLNRRGDTRHIAADVVRIADGALAEHWDVLQDEATRAESTSGLPMFGDSFAD